MNNDVKAYNEALSAAHKTICDHLYKEIDSGLPEAENKLWHGSPVWFIEGNPIVGYNVLKSGVRLLFWSGQSFSHKGLQPEGSFKAAELRISDLSDVNSESIQLWLKESEKIQWDYKNIVKRRGVLERLK